MKYVNDEVDDVNAHNPIRNYDFFIFHKMRAGQHSALCRTIICLALFLVAKNSFSQGVGIGTLNPNVNAILDMADTTRGVLIPRMDSLHRVSIPNTEGLLLYDSSAHAPYFNDGSAWRKLQSSTDLVIQHKVITKESWWSAPGNSTTVDLFGFDNLITGTAFEGPVQTNNFFSGFRRLRIASASSPGSSAGTRHGITQFWRGNAPGLGGFLYVARFGISSFPPVNNTQRTFVGLTATLGALPNANPSSMINMLGFGFDANDNTWYFMHNNGSGTAVKDPIPASFPPRSLSTDMFEIRIYCAPNPSYVYYSIENLGSGNYFVGSTNADLPNVLLSPQIWTNNGALGDVSAIDVVYQYIQTR